MAANYGDRGLFLNGHDLGWTVLPRREQRLPLFGHHDALSNTLLAGESTFLQACLVQGWLDAPFTTVLTLPERSLRGLFVPIAKSPTDLANESGDPAVFGRYHPAVCHSLSAMACGLSLPFKHRPQWCSAYWPQM